MIKNFLAVSLLAFSNVVAANAVPGIPGKIYKCVAYKVWDGDTLDAKCKTVGAVRLRLHQVDAPELKQAYGVQSRRWLLDKTKDKTLSVKLVELEKVVTRTPRWVSELRIGVRTNTLNKQAVIDGVAWISPGYVSKTSNLFRLQRLAKQNKTGLWIDANPIAPWDYRHGKR